MVRCVKQSEIAYCTFKPCDLARTHRCLLFRNMRRQTRLELRPCPNHCARLLSGTQAVFCTELPSCYEQRPKCPPPGLDEVTLASCRSTLAPASRRMCAASTFPARTAQWSGACPFSLSMALTEALFLMRKLVGSGLQANHRVLKKYTPSSIRCSRRVFTLGAHGAVAHQ